jgi:hypothetical protein
MYYGNLFPLKLPTYRRKRDVVRSRLGTKLDTENTHAHIDWVGVSTNDRGVGSGEGEAIVAQH